MATCSKCHEYCAESFIDPEYKVCYHCSAEIKREARKQKEFQTALDILADPQKLTEEFKDIEDLNKKTFDALFMDWRTVQWLDGSAHDWVGILLKYIHSHCPPQS